MRRTALILTLLLFVPSGAHAACNLIPGATRTFHGAVGALTRPYAAGGERVEIKLRPCDTSPGFGATTTDHLVTVLFEPPSGPQTMFILTDEATCAAIDATECAGEVGSNAICISAADAGIELVDRDGTPHLGFTLPDTDAFVDAIGDGRTLAGPATIAVTAAGEALPCGLANGTCTGQGGTVACIDSFFANDGSCTTTDGNPIFPHFTALPPPNDYQADCVNEMPPCTALETEIRFALDTNGNVLLPIDWEGILVRDGPIPVPRLMRGTLGLGFDVPGQSFLASYTPEGGELAPIFEQQNDPTTPAGVTTFFGSADAPYTILRFARRPVALTACAGGVAAGLACNIDDECPGSTCEAATCVGGANDTLGCTSDGECPGGECGPALFDFSPALIAGGIGPAVLSRLGDGVCQEDVSTTCTVGNCGGDGPCVRYKMEALNPVPLEGLQVTDDARTFIVREDLDGVDRTGDGDAVDSAVTFRDRETGLGQPLGADDACAIPGVPEGRAVIRVSDPPFSFPAVATEGPYLAFLESEGTTNVPGTGLPCDQNDDNDRFDGLLRIFELGDGSLLNFDITADADPMIDGRSIAISDGKVFFRTAEWMQSERTTTRASVKSIAEGGGASASDSWGPAITPNARFIAFTSSAPDLVSDDDIEGYDDIFLHDTETGDTERVSLQDSSAGAGAGEGHSRNPAISADARFVAFESEAEDLVLGDDNEHRDIFVRDRCISNGVAVPQCIASTTRVSIPDFDLESEDPQANDDCFDPAISWDGRHVAFRSTATSLISAPTGGMPHIFVHDRTTGATVVVSMDDNNDFAVSGVEGRPAMSADGRFVAFTTASDVDTTPAGTDGTNVFVRDRDFDEDGVFDEEGVGTVDTETVSVPTGGGFFGEEGDVAFGPSISASGRWVAFVTSVQLDEDDTNSADDVAVRDRVGNHTERVSRQSSGAAIPGASTLAQISPDGRYVAFVTDGPARDDDTNSGDDVYMHDRLTAITERVSVAPDGSGISGIPSGAPSLSTDARTVAFDSFAADILAPFAPVQHVYLRGNGPADPNDFFFDYILFNDDVVDDVVLQVFDPNDNFFFPLCPAEDTSVAAGNAAFLRPEAETVFPVGKGEFFPCPAGPLNGDGAVDDDTVVQIWRSGFEAENLGRGGTDVALAPAWLAALISEPQDDTNYNSGGGSNDNDKDDDVVQVHRVSDPPGNWTNVRQAADALDIAGTLVAFITPEADQGNGGTNLNGDSGDADTDDRVAQVYEAEEGERTNIGVAAEEFVLGKRDDDTPCGVVQLVAIRTSEAAQGNTNLNDESGGLPTGDADTLDDVLHVYDAVSDTLRNPGQAVTPCRIPECDSRTPYDVNGAKVTFLTLEPDQGGQDLNGDGTNTQLIIQVYDFCTDTVTVIGAVEDNPGANPLLIVEDSQPFAAPAGRCHLNVGCDPETDLCGPGAFCEADTCDVDEEFCVVHDTVACTLDSDCPQCVLREPATCLADEDCPAGTTCEAAIVAVVTDTTDLDDDGVPDARDNCPAAPNTFQADADGDDIGDRCDPRTCGNGIIEPGEVCDDGNTVDGDGCPGICSGCPQLPFAGCRIPTEPGRASLTLDDRTDDRRDRLRWRWSKGQATTKAEYGDPFAADDYHLCIYDAGGLVGEAEAPAGGTCNDRRPAPCWREKTSRFTYRDLDLTPAGVRKLVLRAGRDGRAQIDIRTRGPLFAMPDLTALASPVTVQLANSSGLCWEAVYSAPFSMQGPTRFRALSD